MPYWFYQRLDVVRQTARHAAARRTEPWLYKAKDGHDLILFGVGRDNASWRRLKQWYQSEGFGLQFDDPRFDDPRRRQPGRGSPEAEEIMAETARFIAAHDSEYIYRGGQGLDQAWGTVRSPDETLEDPHLWDRGFFVRTSGDGLAGERGDAGWLPTCSAATPWELRPPGAEAGRAHRARSLRNSAEMGMTRVAVRPGEFAMQNVILDQRTVPCGPVGSTPDLRRGQDSWSVLPPCDAGKRGRERHDNCRSLPVERLRFYEALRGRQDALGALQEVGLTRRAPGIPAF